MLLRASIGTLAVLGLVDARMRERPNTAYLLQYAPNGCRAGCLFCLQSRKLYGIGKGDYLGRVSWPVVNLEDLASAWKRVFKRVCFQTVIKPGFAEEALQIINRLRSFEPDLPISLATTPTSTQFLNSARDLGVNTLGIGLDAASQTLFDEIGKPYSWSTYWRFIEKSVEVFGKGNVYVHLVVGLGESLRDLVLVIRRILSLGANVALFNYVDSSGKSPVSVRYYRLAQIARYLVENGLDPEYFIDYQALKVFGKIPINVRPAFLTSGCPDCNRPFYNESPRGPLYNIPSENLLAEYEEKLRAELAEIGVYY